MGAPYYLVLAVLGYFAEVIVSISDDPFFVGNGANDIGVYGFTVSQQHRHYFPLFALQLYNIVIVAAYEQVLYEHPFFVNTSLPLGYPLLLAYRAGPTGNRNGSVFGSDL